MRVFVAGAGRCAGRAGRAGRAGGAAQAGADLVDGTLASEAVPVDRGTNEVFAAPRASRDRELADRFNSLRKYVVSWEVG